MQAAVLEFPLPKPDPAPAPTPRPDPAADAGLPLPSVFVPPVWAYRHLSHPLSALATLDMAELEGLGGEGWELAAVVSDGQAAHFYLKRLLR
jgi:hypothetical protein